MRRNANSCENYTLFFKVFLLSRKTIPFLWQKINHLLNAMNSDITDAYQIYAHVA